MTNKSRDIRGRRLIYLGLSAGMIAAGALVLVVPATGDASTPVYEQIAPPITTCTDASGNNPYPCPKITVQLPYGHGDFTAMCYSDYTAARTVTPVLANISDAPGACDLIGSDPVSGVDKFRQAVPQDPSDTFTRYNYNVNPQGSHNVGGGGWWGGAPYDYYSGPDTDAYWYDAGKTANGEDNADPYGMDRAGSRADVGDPAYYTYNTWWGGVGVTYYNKTQRLYSDSAVSYFSGHGSMDNGKPLTGQQLDASGNPVFDAMGNPVIIPTPEGIQESYCNKDVDCNPPGGTPIPVGFYLPGRCRSYPGAVPAGNVHKGVCRYNNYRYLLTSTYGRNPASAGYGAAVYDNQVNISAGQVRLGNSDVANGLGVPGLRGNLNWLILQAENTVMPSLFATQWGRWFAGMHAVSTTMNANGSVYYDTNRLIKTFLQFNANPNVSFAQAWDTTLNMLPQNHGTPCGGNGSPMDFSQGGGYGFNGCGCQLTMSVDGTDAAALSRVTNETFTTIVQDDSQDVTAAAFYRFRYACNYDSTAFPWQNP